MKRISFVFLILVMSLFMLTGCGKVKLDGKWVCIKQVDSDGKVTKIKKSEAREYLVFDDDKAVQTVKNGKKDITITHDIEKISDTEYKLIAGGRVEFGKLIIKGNQFYIRIETKVDEKAIEDIKNNLPDVDVSYMENMPEYTDFYYKKVK